MVICLERGADCLHIVQLMPPRPKTLSSLVSFKSRLVLPFWYRLAQVVLEKRPLNRCSVVVVVSSTGIPVRTLALRTNTLMSARTCLWIRASNGPREFFWHCPHAEQDLCICRASVRPFFRLSVRLSVCISQQTAAVARPAGNNDRLLHGAQQRGGRMRAVPRCQRT